MNFWKAYFSWSRNSGASELFLPALANNWGELHGHEGSVDTAFILPLPHSHTQTNTTERVPKPYQNQSHIFLSVVIIVIMAILWWRDIFTRRRILWIRKLLHVFRIINVHAWNINARIMIAQFALYSRTKILNFEKNLLTSNVTENVWYNAHYGGQKLRGIWRKDRLWAKTVKSWAQGGIYLVPWGVLSFSTTLLSRVS